MSDPHPLLAACPREFWHQLEHVHAAQEFTAEAVDELIGAWANAVDPQARVPELYWRLCLAPLLWSLLSYIFDRLVDIPDPNTGLPGEFPEAGFSARETILLLHNKPDVQRWIDQACAAQSLGRTPDEISAAYSSQSIRRAGQGRKTPEVTHGILGRLRRSVMFWEGHAEIVHFGAPFTHAEARRMTRLSKGRIRRLPFPEHVSQLQWSGERRSSLVESLSSRLNNALARFALPYVAAMAPTACLEQLEQVWHWVDKQALPKLVATVLGGERSPYFAALVARVKASQGKLVGIQHGGYYGATDRTWYERLENEFSDVYATWGYRQSDKQVPMPAVRLSQLRLKDQKVASPSADQSMRLFWAHDVNVGGSASLAAVPQFRRVNEYQQALAQGFGRVANKLGASVALRPYPRLPSADALDVWKQNIERLCIEPGAGRSLVAHASEHQLSVFGFPGATGFIEHIHVGLPAIIFCPPGLCPVRSEAVPIFDALIRTGLYVESESALEQSLQNFHSQRGAWWHTPERSAAREQFRRYFCLTSADPCNDWAAALIKWCES